MSENWGCCVYCSHGFRCKLLYRFPSEWFTVSCHSCQMICFVRIHKEEWSIIIAESRKLLHFELVTQACVDYLHLLTPISYGVDFILMHGHSLCWYNQTQILHWFLMELAYLWLQLLSGIQQLLDDPLHMIDAFLILCALDQDIFPKCRLEDIEQSPDTIVNIPIEVKWGICCPSMHHHWSEQPRCCLER